MEVQVRIERLVVRAQEEFSGPHVAQPGKWMRINPLLPYMRVGRHVPQHVEYEHNLCERNETDHHPTDTGAMKRAVGRPRRLCSHVRAPDKGTIIRENSPRKCSYAYWRGETHISLSNPHPPTERHVGLV